MILARLLVAVALFMLIWLVQLIIYPSFVHIDSSVFSNWHSNYMRLISVFVMPLMLVELALLGVLTAIDPNFNHILSCVLLVLIWISTFTQAVPLHNDLVHNGYVLESIKMLIRVNWVRTILWSLLLGLATWDYMQVQKIIPRG